jgi:AcrR family transcriptional regulator
VPTTTTLRESPARRRIIDTAHRLFYAEGIHTVGIDRIIAEAGVAKATFYNHFPAKDDLVCSYLSEENERQRTAAAELRASGIAPREALSVVFDTIVGFTNTPEFRGCAFLNAAAEYPNPGHPVRQVIADHRRWFRALLHDLLAESGHPDPDTTADLLHTLRDGILTAGCLDEPHALRTTAHDGLTRLLSLTAAAGAAGPSPR